MAHVFISYEHSDSDFADALIRRLEKAGYTSWIDSDQLRLGENWRQGIDEAIRNAFVLVVIMTPDARASEYVTYEWSCALGAGIQVIPIMLKPTELHPRLADLHYLNFAEHTNRPWEILMRRLQEIAGEDQTNARHSPGIPTEAGDYSINVQGSVGGSVISGSGNIVTIITEGITRSAFDRAQSDSWNNEGRKQVRQFGVGGGFNHPQAWWLLGHALEYYVDAIKHDPTNQHAWINIAYVYHVIGMKQRAAECIDKALELATPGPNHPGNHYREVKSAIDRHSYLTGGRVNPPPMPDWFREKYKRYL
ncbi:MAG: TIR domain-containing protein [Anaerolineae bacterium]|nr:TIR domain-containing protein [Anaerolineae bacterium]